MTARYLPPPAASIVVVTLALCGCGSTSPAHTVGGGGRAGGASTGGAAANASPGAAAGAAGGMLPGALPRPTRATLILDFTPNAVHAGIFRALSDGDYARENISLSVAVPSATEEPLALVAAGRAQFGLADGSDVAGAIARGVPDLAVMALVQRPLGGLIALASSRLSSPAQFVGRAVGITGVPSDLAVLSTEVRSAGGDPARVHVVDVGFNGAAGLLAGRLAAFTGFVPDDGVGLAVSGHPITAFWLDRHGGPSYPGLVAFTTRSLASSDPALVRDFLAATVLGYESTLRDPSASLADLLRLNPALPRALTAASLRAYLPLFTAPSVPFGTLLPARVAELSKWMLSSGLIAAPVPFARYGTDAFLPRRGLGSAAR
jgi:putative hydroxymethylpyrimidine transport system substrate-binding protein